MPYVTSNAAGGRLLAVNGPVVPFPRRRRDPRSFYEVKAAEKNGDADIYLYDVIGDSWDGTTAKMFAEDLKGLGEVGMLNVYINSPGGSVFDGTAIYNILRRHKADKRVRIDGIAASIASVVAMAGDTIEVAANGMVMIHDPWALAVGDAGEMRKMAETLDKIRGSILGTYVTRSTSTEEQLSAWMSAETWFNAEEAVAAGLADTVVDEVAAAALAQHDLSDYRHAPPVLAAAAAAKAEEGSEASAGDDAADPKTETETETTTPGKPHSAIARMSARLHKHGLKRRPAGAA